ncbi:MAG: O-antigen ligase family protein [Sphingomonadales bacterium]|nr:O-antigen ligase family protein [Sphingomonadales bacterium]
MIKTARQWVLLGYLIAVLLLGGASAAGYPGNMVLQLAGSGLIAWSLWSVGPAHNPSFGLKPFLITFSFVAALQFLPLPPGLWSKMPGRDVIAQGYDLAGSARPWLTYSLDPWGSLQSLIWWIPALALFIAGRRSDAPSTRQFVWALAVLAYFSVLMAGVQALGGTGYFYDITNRGNGVGMFANSNHLGSFLLVTMILVAGQWLHDKPLGQHRQPSIVRRYALIGLLAPFVVGIVLSASLACQLLLIPSIAGIVLIARPEIRINWVMTAGFGLVIAIGIVWLLASGLAANDLMNKSGTAGISRGEFLTNGTAMLATFAPFGSGIGTFRDIYPWFEDAAKVGTTYVNHAHNDGLELIIETGLFGVILIALFLTWLVKVSWGHWNGKRSENPLALAATLAITMVLLHSLVDYPLRTAAVSAVIALCCVMAQRQPDARGALAVDNSGAGRREVLMKI